MKQPEMRTAIRQYQPQRSRMLKALFILLNLAPTAGLHGQPEARLAKGGHDEN